MAAHGIVHEAGGHHFTHRRVPMAIVGGCGLNVSVVLAMRNDFFGATARHDELHQHLARHELLVPAMSRGELESAIREPAKRARHPLPEAVVQLLVEQTIGVGGALAKTANRIFDDLNPDEQRIARRAFLAMVNLGEGAADTRRRAALAEIVAANEQVEDVERVLQRFSRWEVRLVTLGIEASGAITAVAWNMVRMLPTRHSTNFSRNPRLNNSCFMALWETMDS